jgi:hypothetical protein
MQSTDLEEIKAALWEQAFHGCTQVKCPLGQVRRSDAGKATACSASWARTLVSGCGGEH